MRSAINGYYAEVDGCTPEGWCNLLLEFEDANIYQTWAYGAVRWRSRNLSHLVIRKDGEIVAAAQLRIARLPLVPAGIAYLRWGPMCERKGRPFDPDTVAAMVAHLRQEYVEGRGLALQIIPNAFPGGQRALALCSAFTRSGMHPEPSLGHYRTVVVDLGPAAEAIRKRLDQKWRNQLNRSEKNGLTFEVSDSRQAYHEFVRLYEEMRARKAFETTVDVEEFGRMQELLSGPARMHTFLARKDSEPIGALVCSLSGSGAIHLLGATNERAKELKAANFLHWQAMMWLKDRGARCYDLGGIDPEGNPGGYHFKSGFGGAEVTQALPHAVSGGALGEAALRGIAWLRRRRSAFHSTVGATR